MNALENKEIPLDSLEWGRRTDTVKKNTRIKYFLHSIHLRSQLTGEGDDFVNVYSQIMGRVFTTNSKWTETKNKLLDAGIVETDGTFKKGRKCLGFRVAEPYRDGVWNFCNIPFDKPFYLFGKKQTLDHVSLDVERALDILPTIKKKDGTEYSPSYLKVLEFGINNFSADYHVGKTDRVFTYGNNFPVQLRDAILIDGKESVEIDVKNCQPTLLATLYKGEEEYKRYKALVESGEFYEELMQVLGKDRSTTKNEYVVPWIFGGKRPEVDEWFTETFPILTGKMQEERKKHFKRLAFQMQKLEAQCVRHATQIPHLSIHDGLRVAKGNEQKAKADILAAFAKHDLKPIVEIVK